jgi:hypothetical protein
MEMQAWRALWEELFEWGFDRCDLLFGGTYRLSRIIYIVKYFLSVYDPI